MKPLAYLYLAQLVVVAPSVVYWLQIRDWSLDNLTAYAVFPLLGLLAFNIMWFHLMLAAFKRYHPNMFNYKSFYRVTSNIVLALILLHPGLLIYKSSQIEAQFIDYAGDDGRVFVVFGVIAFLIFMLYEVVDRLREHAIVKDNWQFVKAFNRIGMVLIFAHSLQLGQHLQTGWLRSLWLFYGVTLFAYFIWAMQREIAQDR